MRTDIEQEETPGSVLPFDWPWDTNETIWPCRHCSAWRAELLILKRENAVWIREWHASGCPIWAETGQLEA